MSTGAEIKVVAAEFAPCLPAEGLLALKLCGTSGDAVFSFGCVLLWIELLEIG
jgi:hypothetical protein